jgi:hypothetical protein
MFYIQATLGKLSVKAAYIGPNKLKLSTYSLHSVVGITTGYGLEDRGVEVRVPVRSRIFSTPRRPDRLWGPPNLLSNGYRVFFHVGKAAGP